MGHTIIGKASAVLIIGTLAAISGIAVAGFIEGAKTGDIRQPDAVKFIVKERKADRS